MKETILFVDDEPLILESMQRQLRRRFDIVTAASGAEALEKFKTSGPFPVIISDMRMPSMDGVELLSIIKQMYPDTIRLMLTGNNDQETAMKAVNKGEIFKFLTKPCPNSVLIPALALALRQYRLLTAEKELLDKTLKGSIKVLSELLSFTNPTAFSAGLRIRGTVLHIAEKLSLENLWQVEIAAIMSHIGCITLPSEIPYKIFAGIPLSEDEDLMFSQHPEAGADLLANIPRLENISFIIRHQLQPFPTQIDKKHDDYENLLAANIIKAAINYDLLALRGISHHEIIKNLEEHRTLYNIDILEQFKKKKLSNSSDKKTRLRIHELMVGMIAEENIMTKSKTLLVPKGQELTTAVLQGINNFNRKVGVIEPILVSITREYENLETPGEELRQEQR